MVITDPAAAAACLERIGYYRLSGYWYPFRRSRICTNPLTNRIVEDPITRRAQIVVLDDFLPDTTFQQVMDLYVFDKRLRLLFLDAIERVEVALRVDIALLIGQRDPWAHRDPSQLHGKFSTKLDPATGQTEHSKWLARLDATFDRSKEEFAKHFKRKYADAHLPIWTAIELWDFGMLSVFLSGMKVGDLTQLALKYGIPRPEKLLTSWARNINNVRNLCAHHSRLWNRSPADQIAPPRSGEITRLDHIIADQNAQARIYATACVLQFLLRTIHPTSSWGNRLKNHLATFPDQSPAVSVSQAGFPRGWGTLPLWT